MEDNNKSEELNELDYELSLFSLGDYLINIIMSITMNDKREEKFDESSPKMIKRRNHYTVHYEPYRMEEHDEKVWVPSRLEVFIDNFYLDMIRKEENGHISFVDNNNLNKDLLNNKKVMKIILEHFGEEKQYMKNNPDSLLSNEKYLSDISKKLNKATK